MGAFHERVVDFQDDEMGKGPCGSGGRKHRYACVDVAAVGFLREGRVRCVIAIVLERRTRSYLGGCVNSGDGLAQLISIPLRGSSVNWPMTILWLRICGRPTDCQLSALQSPNRK